MVEEKRFDEAIAQFTRRGDYQDSAAQIRKTEYARAVHVSETGDPLAAAKLFLALGDYADAPAQAQAMYDRYYGPVMNPANTAYNEGRYEDVIRMLEGFDLTALPERYSDFRGMYRESCYRLGDELYEAGKPFEALVWYRRIPGYKQVDSRLQRPCYLILGKWTDLGGNVYHFRDDGSASMNGEEVFFAVESDRMYTGATASALAHTHRLTGVTRQHAWLYDRRSGTEVTIYLTRVE